MKKRIYLFLLFAGCATTKDCNGCTANNSYDAERVLKDKYGVEATCIIDTGEESAYLCADGTGEKFYRCSDSAPSAATIKCIPWFSTK